MKSFTRKNYRPGGCSYCSVFITSWCGSKFFECLGHFRGKSDSGNKSKILSAQKVLFWLITFQMAKELQANTFRLIKTKCLCKSLVLPKKHFIGKVHDPIGVSATVEAKIDKQITSRFVHWPYSPNCQTTTCLFEEADNTEF